MPKYTRLKNNEGTVVTSADRPEVLADYFEHKQWGATKTEQQIKEDKKDPHFKNNVLFLVNSQY